MLTLCFIAQARLLLRLGLSGALALDDIEGEEGVVFLFCSEEGGELKEEVRISKICGVSFLSTLARPCPCPS
jgi:hypothetical protein